MKRIKRLRRVAILCCACTRNLAYYRAGWDQSDPIFDEASTIQRTINSNFLDVAVLEWCKLFLPKEKHAWQQVVTDKNQFEAGLRAHLALDKRAFGASLKELRTYRNKFLAHLDLREIMNIPVMDIAKNSVIYYYDYLLQFENDGATFRDLPPDLAAYYQQCEEEGREFCRH